MNFKGHSCSSFKTVLNAIRAAIERRVFDIYPYLMLQPTIPQRKEAKVIMYNGVCQYFNSQQNGKCICPVDESERDEFFKCAKSVHDALAERLLHSTLNSPGLVRIDIMRIESGDVKRLIVNERLCLSRRSRATAICVFKKINKNTVLSHTGISVKQIGCRPGLF